MGDKRELQMSTLKATYLSVLFKSWREHEICFRNSTFFPGKREQIRNPRNIENKNTDLKAKTKKLGKLKSRKLTGELELLGLDIEKLAGAHF